MTQLPVPGVRNVMGGLIGPYEKRKDKWQIGKWGWLPVPSGANSGGRTRKGRLASLLGASALSLAAAVALLLGGMTAPAHSVPIDGPAFDAFGVDRTAPVMLAGFSSEAMALSREKPHAAGAEDDAPLLDVGFNEWINIAAVLAVIWIALRTERLRRQTDDTGRFRRLHERMDDHSRRLAAHETRLQGLPTHKDLARIDARLVAVEHTMQQIAHSVTRMEDFLINGVAASAAIGEMSHDA